MKSVFQITFPQEPGASFPIEDSRGRPMPVRARSDFRRTNIPTRALTREEWDDQRKPTGYYLRPFRNKVAVPNVDFEAEDGTIHQTAEACLAHELKARFGVETLAEVQEKLNQTAESYQQVVASVCNPPFTPALETNDDHHSMMNGPRIAQSLPPEYLERILQVAKKSQNQVSQPSQDEAVRLLASALSRRGLKHAEAAKATGLTSRACRELAQARPDLFRDKAGKLYLVG